MTGDAMPLFNPRRGWAGDVLESQGQQIGSCRWLHERKHQKEAVRLDVQSDGLAAITWLNAERA